MVSNFVICVFRATLLGILIASLMPSAATRSYPRLHKGTNDLYFQTESFANLIAGLKLRKNTDRENAKDAPYWLQRTLRKKQVWLKTEIQESSTKENWQQSQAKPQDDINHKIPAWLKTILQQRREDNTKFSHVNHLLVSEVITDQINDETGQKAERRQAIHPTDALCLDSSLPAPEEPFRVIWNHPDPCERKAPLHLVDNGIDANANRQFYGDQIKTYYAPGEWPWFEQNGTAVHGGLPQTLDLSHFDALRDYLIKYMDSPAFDGLAVMDFENWRPVFEGNLGPMRIYQSKSRELAHLLHPELNQTALQREAEMEFNHAARGLFEKSLEIGQELMPNAYWGYFYMPRIWGYDVHNTALVNNKLDWLWNVSTALYPRIYMDDLNPPVITRDTNARYVRETLKEALRVKETFCRHNTPIYAFAKSLYGLSDLYDKADLDIGIGMAAQMGIDGVVVWGTSMYYRQAGFCEKQQAYVHDILGPYVRNLTSFMKDCSHQLCSGHGRCVYNNFDSLPQPLPASDSTHGATLHSRYQDYHCRCYFQWGGENCKTHIQSPCQPSHGHTSAPLVG